MDINIGAKIVPDNCTLWRLFPGKSYRLLEAFKSTNTAFLELPDIEIPNDDVGLTDNLLAKILASQDLVNQRIEHGPEHLLKSDWRDFTTQSNSPSRGRTIQAVINFYEVAKKGDLLVVPSYKSQGEILIGEFLDDPDARMRVTGVEWYGDVAFEARNIKWFPLRSEDSISPRLSSILRHPHPFSHIEDKLYNEILSLAYENFIWNGKYGSVVYNGNDNFLDSDNTLVGVIFKLAAYACIAEEAGQNFIDIEDIFEFLFKNPPAEYSCHYSAESHSPGYGRYFGIKPTPIVAVTVIAGLLALSSIADARELKAAAQDINFVNHQNSHNAECDPPISNAAAIVFRSLRGDQLRKACESMLESKNRAELRVRARVAKQPPKKP
ncbi:hypothetical protein [Methylobacterium sp. Leaf93]|uniref:hypothetical protein n=1 Tax=Methylobacterium sp. Leaf93 TaxID=1736249 RepID=UPI000AA092A6|nr:hypothetical protein [Methylobacterium sp. Leaf93]